MCGDSFVLNIPKSNSKIKIYVIAHFYYRCNITLPFGYVVFFPEKSFISKCFIFIVVDMLQYPPSSSFHEAGTVVGFDPIDLEGVFVFGIFGEISVGEGLFYYFFMGWIDEGDDGSFEPGS